MDVEENMWKDCIVLKNTEKYIVVRVTSSGVMFRMKANYFEKQRFLLISQKYEETTICNVNMELRDDCIVISMEITGSNPLYTESDPLNLDLQEYQDFWITWYNGIIQMGKLPDYKAFVSLKVVNNEQTMQFARFDTNLRNDLELIVHVSPIKLKKIDYKIFNDTDLRWERVRGNVIPLDAIVGGYENEPIYIARAHHNRSTCPGKYVRSKGMAFVAWGGREHSKRDFEVLCGYDYQWVTSQGHYIPENAFVAGSSEIRNEPLYVARAKHDGYLITGKVHALYGTCYLPFEGKEVECGYYEILVRPSGVSRGSFLAIKDRT